MGYGALRTGLPFLPTALAFGAFSLLWRGVLACWQPALVPGWPGHVRGGDGVGGWQLPPYAVNDCGMALAYAPTLARALATVRPAARRAP